MYDLDHTPWKSTLGTKVSFDRPYSIYINLLPSAFNPLTNGSGEFIPWEFPLCFWMEEKGYDVTYTSNTDTHSDADGLLRTKAFLSVGHDEYWTYKMVDNVKAARDKGVDIMFLSGNSVSGVVFLEPSSDKRPERVMGRLERGATDLDDKGLMGATSPGAGGGAVCEEGHTPETRAGRLQPPQHFETCERPRTQDWRHASPRRPPATVVDMRRAISVEGSVQILLHQQKL
jgi:hypothetical protein